MDRTPVFKLVNQEQKRNVSRKKTKKDPNRVRVYLRVKPGSDRTSQSIYKIAGDRKQLCAVNALGHYDRDKWYTFDHIYNESAGNKEVYKLSGQNLVDNVMKGFNCSLFAYGQTGSGKTHTLMSADGMTAYMVSRIFSRISRDPFHQYKVTCSYLQIYQERIYDLLNSNANLEFRLREDPREGIFVENLTEYTCYSPNDVYELLNVGRKRLIFEETKMNRHSSRSHAICQLSVSKQNKSATDDPACTSVRSSRSSTSLIPELPEIFIDDSPMSPLPSPEVTSEVEQQTSPPLPFKKPALLKHHSSVEQQPSPPLPFRKPILKKHYSSSDRPIVLKRDVENAPPCNLSSVRRSRSKSAEDPKTNRKLGKSTEQLVHGTMIKTRTTAVVVKTTSKIPLHSSMELNSNNNTRNCKTPESSSHLIKKPQYGRSKSTLSVDPGESFRQRRSLSAASIKRSTTPIGNTRLSRTCSGSSSIFNSSESLTWDSTADDLRWKMRKSTLDLSKLDDDQLSVFSTDSQSSEEFVRLKGKLSIIDLAGSERTNRTRSESQQLREAKHINVSLLELGNVISALTEKHNHIPYRNSILTRLLRDSLSGNSKTSFVLCVSPSMEDIVETQNTLQFGQRLLKLKMKPCINTEPDYKNLVEDLKLKMKESEITFEAKIKEYEEKLSNLRSEKNKTEAELYQQNSLSRLLKDEVDASYSKRDDTKAKLESLEKRVSISEFLLDEKDVELEKLKLENLKLSKANRELKEAEQTLGKLIQERKQQRTPTQQHTSDVGTNTCNEDDPGYYDKKILDKRNKELHEISIEYQALLRENEQMRLHKMEHLERSTCTSPIHSFDISTNTDELNSHVCKTNCTHSELERMRNFLLAEVTSVQLMYSMFDFKAKLQMDRESVLTGVHFVNKTSSLREKCGGTNSSMSTPSGYETQSHSQNSLSEAVNTTEEKRALQSFSFLDTEKDGNNTSVKETPTKYNGGNFLEEIIEAQRTGSCLLSSPVSVKDVPIENRVIFMKKEICEQKKVIDEEFTRMAALHLGISEQSDRLHKRELYSTLAQRLTDEEFYRHYTLDVLEQILNLVIVDHSLTGCLLALSHKTKTGTLNMIRRLSSYKSTSQKPLLDYTYIDHEFYGYENEACNVFHSDDSDGCDQSENVRETTGQSFVDILNYEDHHNFPIETKPIHNGNTKNFANGMLALDSDNDASSDSDIGSPVPQKKGLRRFFCMPKKTGMMKNTMKKTTSGSSIGNSVRRSFRRPSKKKDTALLDFEQ